MDERSASVLDRYRTHRLERAHRLTDRGLTDAQGLRQPPLSWQARAGRQATITDSREQPAGDLVG